MGGSPLASSSSQLPKHMLLDSKEGFQPEKWELFFNDIENPIVKFVGVSIGIN